LQRKTLTRTHPSKETEEERKKSNITKEVWKKGEEGAKMLVEYVKNIILWTKDTNTQIGTKKERTKNDEENRKWTKKKIRKTTNEN
jgi:hypothetical protein